MPQNQVKFYHSVAYVPYRTAFSFMQSYVDHMHEGDLAPAVWFLEHPPLYTSGMSAKPADMLSYDVAPVYKTNRGGQITYHGPGQQIAYAMIPLAGFKNDVRAYVRFLEDWLIKSLNDLGVDSFRLPGKIGIWVNVEGSPKKIAALGVRVKKWIAYHGIALNNKVNLSAFDAIIPCGIQEFGVTSLQELGINVSDAELQKILQANFGTICG